MIIDSKHIGDLARDRFSINRIPVEGSCYVPDVDDELINSPEGRLRWARIKAGYESAAAFAERLSMSDVTYRSYENGQVGYAKHAVRFGKLLGVSADWLIGGGPVPDGADKQLKITKSADDLIAELGIAMVRQVDISYAMGDGAVIEDYPDTGKIPFDLNFMSLLGVRNPDKVFVCRGDGDSMSPTIFGGDIVMVDTSRTRITMQDQIWALAVAGAGMIKRIRPLPNNKILVLSDNPLVPDQEYDSEDVFVVGRVIWIGRRI